MNKNRYYKITKRNKKRGKKGGQNKSYSNSTELVNKINLALKNSEENKKIIENIMNELFELQKKNLDNDKKIINICNCFDPKKKYEDDEREICKKIRDIVKDIDEQQLKIARLDCNNNLTAFKKTIEKKQEEDEEEKSEEQESEEQKHRLKLIKHYYERQEQKKKRMGGKNIKKTKKLKAKKLSNNKFKKMEKE